MKNFSKSNKGITLIALGITVIIIAIIASITVYSGKEVLKEARVRGIEN
jgi:Tfp pilus assembly protein PilE